MKQNDFYEVDGCTDFIPVKLIGEHKHKTNTLKVALMQTGDRVFVPSIYSLPKPHEPQKPVVPKFVAEWVDNSREYNFDFDEWLDYENQPSKVNDWLNSEKKRQAELNMLALVTLIVNGPNAVEIEKEKLYTVRIPNPNLIGNEHTVLAKNGFKKIVMVRDYGDNWKTAKSYHLTESEIKQDFDFLWEFAKPVEGNK